nr:MAG: YopX protein [Bacteriophage sp.]
MNTKFRAWDKQDKEIYLVEEINFNRGEFESIGDGITFLRESEKVELMLSTGVFDKNGKEIFEGDIIRTNAYGCIVGFGEYTYFEDEHTQTTEIGFYLSFLNVTPATYAPFDKYYWDNCEVIGNIYENELDLIMYEVYKYNKKTSEDKE